MRVAVCFVCLGNICRSPIAEGVMWHLVGKSGLAKRLEVESAGTAAYHVGELPDPRARRAAQARGIALESRARQFSSRDFRRFHHVIAMDRANADDLRALAPDGAALHKIRLLRSFALPPCEPDVPDPYYGDDQGFEGVLDICLQDCHGLLDWLVSRHGLA